MKNEVIVGYLFLLVVGLTIIFAGRRFTDWVQLNNLKPWRMVKHGEAMPPFFGIAVFMPDRHEVLCTWVPFNWLVSLAVAGYAMLRTGNQEIVMDPRAAFMRGIAEGMRIRDEQVKGIIK